MSEQQLLALLLKVKEDSQLRACLQHALSVEALIAIAQEAGFDVCKSDWIKFQDAEIHELDDQELEQAAGGCGLPWLSEKVIMSMIEKCGDRFWDELKKPF